jgi:hypothetical protein
MISQCVTYNMLDAESVCVRVFVTHLLAIMALMNAWMHKNTPESSIVPDYSLCRPVSLYLNLFFIYQILSLPISRQNRVKNVWQTTPRWRCEPKFMLTILPYLQWTLVQHPTSKHYCENRCALLADIWDMEIPSSSRFITNSVLSPATQLSLIKFCRVSMLFQFGGMKLPQILKL